MTIKRPFNVKETAEAARRHPNWVRNAANSGALKSLPRRERGNHQFTEQAVQAWIDAGSPEMPPVQLRLTGTRKSPSRVSS